MKKKQFRRYVSDTFQFNIAKEKAIYFYLCKEKMNKKQKRLLNDETKFKSYIAWKSYIVSKFGGYNKDGLIEFDRILNLLLQNSGKINNFIQCI